MSRNDVWKAASLALALGASTSGVLALAARGGGAEEPPQAAAAEQAATTIEAIEVRTGVISMPVHVTGRVTPTGRVAVSSSVAAIVPIRSILPSGTRVQKGDLIAELDVRSVLEMPLTEQRNKAENARARYEYAKLAREVAEIAVKEYDDGIYPQEKASLQQEIQAAEAAIVRSQERVDRVKRLREDSARLLEERGGAKTPADLGADQDAEDRLSLAKLSLERDRFMLEAATSKLKVLEQYTRSKTLTGLRSAVQQALSDEKAREYEAELERAKDAGLEKQLAAGRILAPVDGVVAAVELPGTGLLGRGSQVRERQTVAYVQRDVGRLAVTADVPEVSAPLIRPGLAAGVTTFGGPGRQVTVEGVVETVGTHSAPLMGLPVPPGSLVLIALQDPPAGSMPAPLRVGSAVRVEFPIESAPDALGVPRRGLVWYDGAYHVGVRGGDGQVEWREVVTGLFNEETVEIRSGLKAGEAVVADPDPLLSDDQRRRIAIAPPPPPGLPPIPGQVSGGMGGFQ